MNKLYNLLFTILLLVFSLSSCAYFEDDEEKILPGKRVSIFDSEEEVILKANKKIVLEKPKSSNSWSQQHQNLRNHLFHFKSKANLKLIKKVNLGEINLEKTGYFTPPVIINDLIFFYDNSYTVSVKNLVSGKVFWKLKLKDEQSEKFPLVGGFFLDKNFLIISTGLGNIYNVSADTGEIKWKKKFDAQFSRPPTIYKNKIFVVSDDNQFFAIDKNTGEEIWNHLGVIEELSIIGGSKPVIDKEVVVVTYSSGEIFAFNTEDGSILWFENISSGNFLSKTSVNDIQSPLCIEGDVIYVPTFSNKLLAYDLKSGKSKWDINLSSTNPLVISGDIIYILDINGKLMSLEKSSGKLLWAVQLRLKKGDIESFWIGPLLSTNKLLIMSSNGTILSLSPYSGKTLSKIQFKESFIAGPFQVQEKIFLISEQGTLFVLG